MASPPANQAGAICYYDEALGQLVTVSVVNGLPISAGGGVPQAAVLAAGEDAYAEVLETPDRVCSHVIIQLDAGDPAIISFDGGVTDGLYVKAGAAYALDGVRLESGSSIQARNGSAGSNFTNLRVTVW
jgi:hypothetical protein